MTFLILTSIPIQSGTGIRISNIARSLAEKGHQVTLTGIGSRPAGLENVRYQKVPDSGNRVLTLLLSLFINLWAVMTHRAEVLLCSKALPNSALPAFFFLSGGTVKVLDLDDLEYGYWAGTWKGPVLRWMDRLMVRPFDRIAVHTGELRQYALNNLSLAPEKVIFLRQGVRFSHFQGKESDIKERLGLQAKKIILYTAHIGIAARGGLEFILQGCGDLLRERDIIHLLIIGSGDRMAQYKKMASEMGLGNKVLFAGGARYEAMPDFFAASDVSVNYLEDTEANRCRSSIKVRESLAAGVPVVCNIVGSDLARFRPYLYIYETGSTEGLRKRLEEALFHPQKKRIEEARRFLQTHWDWDLVVNDFLRELPGDA